MGSAPVSADNRTTLEPISEFGAKPCSEDEKNERSAIIKEFNDRYGANVAEAGMIRLEQFNRRTMNDDLSEMLRNGPQNLVYTTLTQAFYWGVIRMFQRDNGMPNILLTKETLKNSALPIRDRGKSRA